jgi:hypothetical protein
LRKWRRRREAAAAAAAVARSLAPRRCLLLPRLHPRQPQHLRGRRPRAAAARLVPHSRRCWRRGRRASSASHLRCPDGNSSTTSSTSLALPNRQLHLPAVGRHR